MKNAIHNQLKSYRHQIVLTALGMLLTSCAHSNYPNLEKGVYETQQETFEGYRQEGSAENLQNYLKELFQTEPEKQTQIFASENEIEAMSDKSGGDYLMGAGDQVELTVWGRPEISRPSIVASPDGLLAVPRIGYVNVKGVSIRQATEAIKSKLSVYYSEPDVVLSVKQYANNKAFVLGRVANPGVVNFTGEGTLLEALSLAGGLPVIESDAFLTKCSVIRGKEQIVWIDLRELLNKGNLSLNMRIKNNDIIFIPESEDELIYIMGEVKNPGPIRLKTELTVLDAIMFAGGPNKIADVSQVYIVRGASGKGIVAQVNIKDLLAKGDFSKNFLLKDNDVVFVSQTGISQFNYLLENLTPSLQFLNMSASLAERTGALNQLRNKLWGQEGFINSSQ